MDAESTLRNVELPAQPAASRFEVGQILDGKYEILTLLGRGGMGSVYRAKHLLLNIEVALKTLDSELIGDATSSRRFQTEAKAAFSLKHPNLVKVHDYGVLDDGHPFLVMDLVKGKTLQALIKERGQLSVSEVCSIFPQICFGLAHAHEQQVVHRDIKPANIMIVDDVPINQEGSVKILDFGIAKIVNADRGEMQTLTQTGEIFGSPSYMSPEQCTGEAIDARSDVYSLGCVVFETLTGTPPFSGSNALRTMMMHVNESAPSLKEAALGKEFPEALEQIVSKMLAKRTSDRYAEMGLIAHDLFVASGRSENNLKEFKPEVPAGVRKKKASFKNYLITLSYSQLALTLGGTVLISALCTLELDRYRGNSNSLSLKQSAQNKIVSPDSAPRVDVSHVEDVSAFKRKSEEAKEAFGRVSHIKAVPNQFHNRETILFPEIAMGNLRFSDGGVLKDRPAQGEIDLPCGGAGLNIVIDECPQMLGNGSVMAKIDPLFLRSLSYGGPDIENSEIAQNAELLRMNDKFFDEMISTAATWPKLERLFIWSQKLTTRNLDEIDKMQALVRLDINNCSAPPNAWTRRVILNRISILFVRGADSIVLLESAAKSKSIQKLGVDCEITPADMKKWQSCKQLKEIFFGQQMKSDEVIRTVSKFEQLRVLQVQKSNISEPMFEEVSKTWKAPLPPSASDRETITWVRK